MTLYILFDQKLFVYEEHVNIISEISNSPAKVTIFDPDALKLAWALSPARSDFLSVSRRLSRVKLQPVESYPAPRRNAELYFPFDFEDLDLESVKQRSGS